MGFWDWVGPLGAGNKRRGWDALPAERKASWTIYDQRAIIRVPTLVHGPGATEALSAGSGGWSNSAVYACLQAIATAVAEPEPKVYRTEGGDKVEQLDSDLAALLRSPNPAMSLDTLLWHTAWCLHVDGNAYWRKLRNGEGINGDVVELWPISPQCMKPMRTRPEDFISFWRYQIDATHKLDIETENIVHFQLGMDDADHRLGLSPLKRLMREVSSDEQATRYADRLLANAAIPGLSLEWEKDAETLTADQAAEIKSRLQSAYSGDNAGSVSVLSPGARLVQHGFSPEQMDLKVLHRVPEERIAAVMGIPAIVAGLGAGLDRSTYSNFKEAREAFTETKLIPLWRSLAATMTMSLAPDFNEQGVVEFDISDVRALADDQNALAVRLQTLVAAGILTVDEARAELGREPAPVSEAAAAGDIPSSSTRSRGPLYALPSGIERKAASDMPDRLTRLRDEFEPDWHESLAKHLTDMQRRVDARLRAGRDNAEDLVPETEAALLGETLTPHQLALLEDVHAVVLAELAVEFQLDDASTRQYLAAAGSNIHGITATTRDAVRAALIEGQAAGEGVDKLAARLRDLPEFGSVRARIVARTELASASNHAALSNYRASGVVVGIRVHDGDTDAVCAAMNGRTFALSNPPPTLGHPNCVRALAPVTDAAELVAAS